MRPLITSRRQRRATLIPLLSILALLAGPPAFAEPPGDVPRTPLAAHGHAVGVLDTGDRAVVAAAYREVYLPSAAVVAPAPPPGAVGECDSGAAPEVLQQATLDLVNYVRAMSGVGAVTFDATLSAKAQQAALMMSANGALDHAPPTEWSCYSTDGAEAAGRSNLALGAHGAGVVRIYADDGGSANAATGRRYWLQRPAAQTMGSGYFGSAHALWVVGDEPPAPSPAYTSWPSAGYFPSALEPNGRWSFTAWRTGADLSQATVSVTDDTGTPVPATAHPVTAPGSLVFEVGDLPEPAGMSASVYTVTVSNILLDGVAASYSYAVRLFDPMAEPFTALTPPTMSGTARVGSTLTAGAPTWSQNGVTTRYRWLRNGQPISGATSPHHVLVTPDIGTTITVRTVGTKPGYPDVTTTSALTATISKIPAAVSLHGSSKRAGAVSLSITVSASPDPAPSGTVRVKQGTKLLRAKLPLTNGRASYTTTGSTPGRYTYTVGYPGTSRIGAATGSDVVQIKAKASPTITLRPSVAPAKVSIDITVAAAGQPPLGGTAYVKEGRSTLTSRIKISNGRATWAATGIQPGTHTYRIGYSGTSQVSTGSQAVTVKIPAPIKLVSYANCGDLRRVHPHGVGRKGATDKTSGTPVTSFLVNTPLYLRNDGQPKNSGEKDLDRDNDGVACEKQ